MSSLSAIASAGLATAQTQFQASAQRIARLGSAGPSPEPELSGLAMQSTGRGAMPARAAGGPSLESDLVGLLQAKNGLLASLAVFKTSDQMSGALLDIFG